MKNNNSSSISRVWLLWIYVVLHTFSFALARSCHFPLEWRGDWYQADFKVFVSDTAISSPSNVNGVCHRRDGHKILLRQEDNDCYTCVVFTPRHANILQYKKGDCLKQDSLSLCKRISGDSVLYTLLRLPSRPVRCPFEGPYTFSYNDRAINCDKQSTIEACADDSAFRLSYKYCGPPGHGNDGESKNCRSVGQTPDGFSEGRELQRVTYDFRCLATWHSGNDYLYAQRLGPTIQSQADMYRCFVHSPFGGTGAMSRSADPSCRLVGGPTEGDFRLTLVKDYSKWPKAECKFPHFVVKHEKWRDLSGKYLLQVDRDYKTIRLQKRIMANGVVRYEETYPRALYAFRCLSPDAHAFETRTLIYRTFTTTHQCTSHYQCVRMEKRSSDVVDFYIGKKIKKGAKKCGGRMFANATKYVFIPAETVPTSCPKPGTYHIEDGDCGGLVKIGCGSRDEIIIETKCPDAGTSKVDILRCLKSWGAVGHNKKHVIVDKPGDPSMAATCLTFEEKHNKMIMASADVCSPQVSRDFFGHRVHYKLNLPAERCAVSPTQITNGYESRFDRPNAPNDHASPTNTAACRTSPYIVASFIVLVMYSLVTR